MLSDAKYSELSQHVQSFLKEFPNDHSAWNISGIAFDRLGLTQNAIQAFEAAIKIKYTFVEAHLNLALAYEKVGYLEKSLEHYIVLSSFEENNVSIHCKIGSLNRKLGQYSLSINAYEFALTLNNHDPTIYNSLGLTFLKMGQNIKALEAFKRSTSIQPLFTQGWNNMGNTYQALDNDSDAVLCYQRALEIDYSYKPALTNLAQFYRDNKSYTLSYELIKRVDSRKAKAQALECLFLNKNFDQFYKELADLAKNEENNIRVAALSAYASHQLGKKDIYPFCPEPLNYLSVYNLLNTNFSKLELNKTLGVLNSLNAEWEPNSKTTMQGFQTVNTLFDDAHPQLNILKKLVEEKIDEYLTNYGGSDCLFIKDWPSKYKLSAWYVRLIKGGHQSTHIHPAGWLSGVVYLKTIDNPINNEGAIKFGLRGFDYQVIAEEPPFKLHQPKVGDIVLFPSSLFHETIPVVGDHERSVLAFDVIPIH